jgi:elongation of very long chain fatty acids protein 7
MARTTWLYYISKFTEFFDTFFFVMRKRYDQVSTLHVIHHGIMPVSGQKSITIKCLSILTNISLLTVWWGVKFYPGGHGTFFGFLNSGVHVVMYE